MSDKQDPWLLNLHEEVRIDTFYVRRVPGGWIYSVPVDASATYEGQRFSAVFVPYVSSNSENS